MQTQPTCLGHPRFPHLRVIPYVRGRLAFAQLAALALEGQSFDRVLTDLPRFMQEKGWLELPLRLFPLASSLILKKDPVPLLFPFVPTDAACLAAFLARKSDLPFDAIDDPYVVHYPDGALFQPETPLRDDHRVLQEGPEAYFGPVQAALEALWKDAPFVQRAFTSLRADRVARALEGHLAQGHRVLFVCEYRLWWSVRRRLDSGGAVFEMLPAGLEWEDLPAALVVEDPDLLWSQGLFDDYPAVNLAFWQALQGGTLASFDRRTVLEGLLADLRSPESPTGAGSPSLRMLAAFERYLRTRVVASQRALPLPASQLLDAAQACAGREFAQALARRLLEYPTPELLPSGAPSPVYLLVTPAGILAAREVFGLPDLLHCRLYGGAPAGAQGLLPSAEGRGRRHWADAVDPRLTRQEAAELGSPGSVRWTLEEDFRLHEAACAQVREVVRRGSHRTRVRRSWGSLNDGIHWKATLVARARGERAIYVRQRLRRQPPLGRLDEFTPIAFVFSPDADRCAFTAIHDSNLVQRSLDLQRELPVSQRDVPPDWFFSLLVGRTGTDQLWGPHVEHERVCSLAFLLSREPRGLARYRALSRRPGRCQCRISPLEDPELSPFRRSELGLAWGVKYAERVVIAVAWPAWRPSARLSRFAAQRRVRLVSVPLSALTPGLIGRLRRLHYISTALKRHPEYRRIVGRFLG